MKCLTMKKPDIMEYCFANVYTLTDFYLLMLCYTTYSYTGFIFLP